MSDIVHDYQSGLAAAMLDEGVVRLGHSEDGSGITIHCDPDIVGKAGSQLQDIAAYGYAMTLRESGLMRAQELEPGVVTFSDLQPFVARVMKETLGRDWQWAEENPVIEDMETLASDDQPVLIFDGALDITSVELAKAANRQGRLVGMIALLDMQRGIREALRKQAGVQNVHTVIGLGDIIRYVLRTDRGPITQRECIAVMSQLDSSEGRS